MNNHQQFLASLAAQQNANAQAGLGDDVSINKHQFGANVDLSETYKLIVRKGNKVVESMKVNPKEIDDAMKFAKAQHKGLNVTVEKNGKVVREEWEEYSEPISLSEMNYIGSDKKFGRKFYEKDGQLHVKSKTGTQTQNLGSVDVKSNAKMIKGLKKEETEVEEGLVDKVKNKVDRIQKRRKGRGTDRIADVQRAREKKNTTRGIKHYNKGMDKYDADKPENENKPEVKKSNYAHDVADKAGDRSMTAKYGKRTKFGSKKEETGFLEGLIAVNRISRDEYKKRLEKDGITKSGMKAKVKKGREDAKKDEGEPKSEAIKYDAAHPDQGITGKVTGKGKRDRGPKGSKTSGEVRVKYSGHPAYKKGSPGLPIKANDIGRLIKQARKPKTKPYDSRNLRNPRLTKDHVEHGVAEGMADSAKRAAKILATRTPKNVHNPGHPEKSSAGDREARRRERDRKAMLNNREGVEDMTAAQERDRQHRDNPTRKTVANVKLPSTDAERDRYVKKYQSDRAGKPGNTKIRRMRDLKMKLEKYDSDKEHSMDPKSHVKKEGPNEFCVYHENGKKVKTFDNKKDAEAYAVKNHKELMNEGKKRITKLHGKKYPKGTHYCATHVEHAQFGHGNPIHSQHATPDEFGDIEWYDVMFEHGIEQSVPTDDLHIHLGEVHENHDHEEGENLDEGPAHQNPFTTVYGGMKNARNTPSMKKYHAKVKAEQEARAKKIAKEREDKGGY